MYEEQHVACVSTKLLLLKVTSFISPWDGNETDIAPANIRIFEAVIYLGFGLRSIHLLHKCM